MDVIVAGQHGDPFAVLGPHPGGDGTVGLRAFLPAARAVAALTSDGTITPLRSVHPGGLWEGQVAGRALPLAYRLRLQAPDRTLKDSEVAEIRQGVIDAVESTHGASLRG